MPHLIRILALTILWPSMVTAQPVIQLSTDSTDIHIHSVEPGGTVALFGAHRRLEDYTTVAGGLQEILIDEDGDGSVTVGLETAGLEIGVPLASVWVAVDLATGSWSAAWPEGFKPSNLAEPTLNIGASDGTEASTTTLEMAGRLLEVFLVRPGDKAQAWHQTLANGGPMDEDPDPASMALRLDALNPVTDDSAEAAPSPSSLAPNDLVILLDPTRLGWQMAQGQALLEAADTAAARDAR